MSTDEIWKVFTSDGQIELGIRVEDLKDPNQPFVYQLAENYESDQIQLKAFLTPKAYSRINARFRKFKQRKLNDQTTITLNNKTLDKIKLFAQKAQLHEESYEVIFEYLLSPEEASEMELAKEKVSQLNLPNSLGITEKSKLLQLALRLKLSTWRLALSQIEYAFEMGWHACKYLNGKKRTEQALNEATYEFMSKMKGLD